MHLGEAHGLRGRAFQTAIGSQDIEAVHPGKPVVHLADKFGAISKPSGPVHHGDKVLDQARRKGRSSRLSDHGLVAVGEVRVLHAQRFQNMFLDIFDVGLAGHLRHDLPQHHVVRIPVGGGRAGLEHRP